MKLMKPLKMVNGTYRLTGVWVKMGARSKVGTAATYLIEKAEKYRPQKNSAK